MGLFRAIGRGAWTTATRIAVVALGILVGIGVPLGWIWVGSQAQETTAPSGTAFAVVIVGVVFTLLLIGGFLSFFAERSKRRRRERSDWMRGMTEERRRDSLSDVHPLEFVIFLAVLIDIVVFVVWFFAFANPGTPVGQG